MLRQRLGSVFVACLLAAFSAPAQSAPEVGSSAVPRLIRFSGVINPQTTQENIKESGKRASTTAIGITFCLYELQDGGSPLWSESQKVQPDEQGRYTVLLGATQPEGLPLDLFTSGKALWLGVQPQLPGAAEAARVLLVAVPYALKASDADTLGGLPAAAYALVGPPASTPRSGNPQPETGNPQLSTNHPQPAAACPAVTSDGTATANFLAKFTAACNAEKSLLFDNGTNIGVGTSTPGAFLDIQDTTTATSGNIYGSRTVTTWNPAASSAGSVFSAFSNAVTKSGNNQNYTGALTAFQFEADHNGTGTLAKAYGGFGAVRNLSTGTITNAYSLYGYLNNGSTGAVKNAYGLFIANPTNAAGGTISNYYGVYISNPTTATTGYGLYSLAATNYLSGKLGINTTSPTASLEVNGTTKFDSTVTFSAAQAFAGTGSGLTSLNASNLSSGTVPPGRLAGTYSNALTLSNASNSFAGNGAALTKLNPANLSSGTAGINISGNAATATNAIELGGLAASAFAQLASASNTFSGSITAAGTFLPATEAATASGGTNSQPLDLAASSFLSTTTSPVNQHFRWQAEPAANNTPSPSGTLNLLFAPGNATPAETGLAIASNGRITFAPGQAFPPSVSTITQISAGIGLTGGGATGNVTLNLDTSKVPTLGAASNAFTGSITATSFSGDGTNVTNVNAAQLGGLLPSAFQPTGSYAGLGSNTFAGIQSISSGDLSLGGGNIDLPENTGSGVGVINAAGSSFIHTCCGASSFNTFVGQFAANFGVTGTSNTGTGAFTLQQITSGGANTATGGFALAANSTGSENTATGVNALNLNATGSNNTADGANSLGGNDAGSHDVAIGWCALASTARGGSSLGCGAFSPGPADADTALGSFAGQTNRTGNSDTFLGYKADAASGALTNATAIGANAVVGESNALVLGGSGANAVSVGIGTATPAFTLDVNGTANFAGLVTFSSGQTFPGGTVTGSETVQGNVSASGQLVSTVATGTAPLQVNSTTMVANLNANFVGGFSAGSLAKLATTNVFLSTQGILTNNELIALGDMACSSGFVGISFGAPSSCGNYSLLGEGTNTMINRPAGGTIFFRENNANEMTLASGGLATLSATKDKGTALTITSSQGNGAQVTGGTDSTNIGRTGLTVTGGKDTRTSLPSTGGIGMVATGGVSTFGAPTFGGTGGDGIQAFGASMTTNGSIGGRGIFAMGGNGKAFYGEAIEAFAGNGPGTPHQSALFGDDVGIEGNLDVDGAITAGTKDFKIDHPLDPANKYLYHSSVESSEMMNIYSGNVVLGPAGQAVVTLPGWFEAENTDFRYQLTPIGAPGPGLYIASEIADHRFTIAGGSPGMKVSWQVMGIRQDAYAKSHPLVVEEEKPEELRGYYIHPQLFGQPEEKQVDWARRPAVMKLVKERRAAADAPGGPAER